MFIFKSPAKLLEVVHQSCCCSFFRAGDLLGRPNACDWTATRYEVELRADSSIQHLFPPFQGIRPVLRQVLGLCFVQIGVSSECVECDLRVGCLLKHVAGACLLDIMTPSQPVGQCRLVLELLLLLQPARLAH